MHSELLFEATLRREAENMYDQRKGLNSGRSVFPEGTLLVNI